MINTAINQRRWLLRTQASTPEIPAPRPVEVPGQDLPPDIQPAQRPQEAPPLPEEPQIQPSETPVEVPQPMEQPSKFGAV
jgi:hypothetical protein